MLQICRPYGAWIGASLKSVIIRKKIVRSAKHSNANNKHKNKRGCEVGIQFPVFKLLDYVNRWDELEKSDNPFALAVMAHLKTQQTRHDKNERKRWKLYLIRKLYERGYKKQDVINLFHFIDWIMRLPEELEEDFRQEITRYEEEKKMRYVSSLERIGIKKGKKEGKKEGRKEGRKEGWQKAIEMVLSVKFGENGMKLIPVIQSLKDEDRLNVIMKSVIKTDNLSEIEALLN